MIFRPGGRRRFFSVGEDKLDYDAGCKINRDPAYCVLARDIFRYLAEIFGGCYELDEISSAHGFRFLLEQLAEGTLWINAYTW